MQSQNSAPRRLGSNRQVKIPAADTVERAEAFHDDDKMGY